VITGINNKSQTILLENGVCEPREYCVEMKGVDD